MANIGLDPALGGYVISLLPGNAHGVVVATQDQGTAGWLAINNMINVAGNHNVAGAQFHNWRLPTKDELALIYAQKAAIGNFQNDLYWSSSQVNGGNAWAINFEDGLTMGVSKDLELCVRAVRNF